MPATPLPVFTPARYGQLAAQSFAQIFDMQTSADTTALCTLIDGSPVVVAPLTAAATTTASASAGDSVITVASATSFDVGQVIYSPGNLKSGTKVTSISGTSIGVSNPVLTDMSGATVKVFAAVTNATGIAVTIGAPLPLGIGSNTHLGYISQAGGYTNGILNVAVGS